MAAPAQMENAIVIARMLILAAMLCFASEGTLFEHDVAFAGSPEAAGQSAMCGDVNGSGARTTADFVALFNHLFLDSTLADTAAADLDSFAVINISDLVSLNGFICCGGAEPSCPPVYSAIVPSVESSDTLTFEPSVVPAFATSTVVSVKYKNSQYLGFPGMALPLRVRVGETVPSLDSAKTGYHYIVQNAIRRAWTIDPTDATINGGLFGYQSPVDSGGLVDIYMTFPAEPYPRSIRIDTLRLQPANSALFRYNIAGIRQFVVPVMNQFGPFVPVAVSGPLAITASATVEMVVIDPHGDSIGVAFNSIGAGSNYDIVGHAVSIPEPYTGNYEVRVNRASGAQDEDVYNLSFTIQNLVPMTPQGFVSRSVPSMGGSDETLWRAALTLPGDLDANGSITAGDIIRLVNHVFKGGDGAEVARHEDVNCDVSATAGDIVYLVNYVFKGGPLPCSQTAG